MLPPEQEFGLQNPFASSEPVADPSRFYGRRGDIHRIYSRIGAERPQSISIIGEKAIGKSSLHNILAHPDTKTRLLSEPDRYLFVHIHLRERDDWTPGRFFQTLTTSLRMKEASDYDGFRALIQQLDSDRLCLIIFLDDFSCFTQNPDFPLTFFSFLRSVANTYNVAYVTSSSESLQRLCVSKDVEESPFFNIFTNIVLKPLKPEDVRQWVIEGSSPSGVSLSSEADWVYTQVGGFPALVRVLCALLWERKQALGKLDDNDLEEVSNAFQAQARNILLPIWKGFNEQEQTLCAHLLTESEVPQPQMHLVRELTRRGYVQETGGSYTLFGKVFEHFVTNETGVKISVVERHKKHRWWRF